MSRYALLCILVLSAAPLTTPAVAATPAEPYRLVLPYVPFHPYHHWCEGEVQEYCMAYDKLHAVWVADMTGDGLDDMVVAPGDNAIWIVPQGKDGLQLQSPRVYTYGDEVYFAPKEIAVGDFNGDGAADVIARPSDTTLDMHLLLSDGKGGHVLRLAPSPIEDRHHAWKFPQITDVDHDGHLDLLYFTGHRDPDTPYESVTNLVVNHGDGTGGFPRVTLRRLADHNALGAALGDFNGDGLDDIFLVLVTGSDPRWAISFRDAQSGYLPAILTDIPSRWSVPAIADFNEDDVDEVTFAVEGVLYALTVPGPITSRMEPIGAVGRVDPELILADDLDRNGRPDLYSRQFVCNGFCTYSFNRGYLNFGKDWGTFGSLDDGQLQVTANESNHPHAYASGDVNADGCTDVVTANGQSGIAIYHGTNCMAPAAPANDDFDGDGESDIIWRHRVTGANVIWRSGWITTPRPVTGVRNGAWDVVATGDFDGDGKSDLFWRNLDTGANALWPSAAPSTRSVRGVTDIDWQVVGSGDFDHDGRVDLFWRHARTGANAIWPGGRPGTAVVAGVRNVSWHVIATGDFDGDRRDDVFWRNIDTGANVIWRAANYARPMSLPGAGRAWHVAGAGDFDGDRKDDVLWRNTTSGATVIWGAANPADRLPITDVTDVNWSIAKVGDYTGDGRADVLWRHTSQGKHVLWRSADSTSQRPMGRVTDLDWQIVPSSP